MINRILYYQLIFIISVLSYLLPNKENEQFNTEKIEVKLNVEPNRIDGREWIPYRSGIEITNKEFWKLLGNQENINYWDLKYKEKEAFHKQTVRMPKLIGLYISVVVGHFQITRKDGEKWNTFSEKHYHIPLSFASTMSVYEIYKWIKTLKYLHNLPIKDPMSYYDIKLLVENYNHQIDYNMQDIN